jgi:hypothetical protein
MDNRVMSLSTVAFASGSHLQSAPPIALISGLCTSEMTHMEVR